jgi:hypothetical protein
MEWYANATMEAPDFHPGSWHSFLPPESRIPNHQGRGARWPRARRCAWIDGILRRFLPDVEWGEGAAVATTAFFVGRGPRLNSEGRLWVAHPCGFVFCKGGADFR